MSLTSRRGKVTGGRRSQKLHSGKIWLALALGHSCPEALLQPQPNSPELAEQQWQMRDAGCGMWDDAGCGMQDMRYGMRDARCGMMQNVGRGMQDAGYGIWDAGCRTWDMGCRMWDAGWLAWHTVLAHVAWGDWELGCHTWHYLEECDLAPGLGVC